MAYFERGNLGPQTPNVKKVCFDNKIFFLQSFSKITVFTTDALYSLVINASYYRALPKNCVRNWETQRKRVIFHKNFSVERSCKNCVELIINLPISINLTCYATNIVDAAEDTPDNINTKFPNLSA